MVFIAVKTNLKSILSLSLTCGDTSQPFEKSADIPFYEGNFHIYDNPVYYGDGTIMSANAIVGAVITFPKGNLRDIYFKNYNAGSNGTVVFVGTVPNAIVEKYTKY